jgi:hypothetical protein
MHVCPDPVTTSDKYRYLESYTIKKRAKLSDKENYYLKNSFQYCNDNKMRCFFVLTAGKLSTGTENVK